MKRGEVWWADLPQPSASGPGFRRPVLILQADEFNRSRINTIVVAAITSNTKLASAPGNVLLSKRSVNLDRQSVVNVSQIVTLDKSFLADRVGRLSAPKLRAVVENVQSAEFNDRFRARILEVTGGAGGANMLLGKDPILAEAILSPKLMTMAEFSVGRGFLISQVAASVRPQGAPSIGLHADNNWVPAPFPAHNMLILSSSTCNVDLSLACRANLIQTLLLLKICL